MNRIIAIGVVLMSLMFWNNTALATVTVNTNGACRTHIPHNRYGELPTQQHTQDGNVCKR